MVLILVFGLLSVTVTVTQALDHDPKFFEIDDIPEYEDYFVAENDNRLKNKDIKNTELLLVFVIYRHGDRTPEPEEMQLVPNMNITQKLFPYGPKALTNKGRDRAFQLGKGLRSRYKNFLSKFYLPDEIVVRTTDYARTQMTALTVLAGLYPPQGIQKWNKKLNWQPIPYKTLPYDEDDLLYWYNCPRYLYLRNKLYETKEIKEKLVPYKDLFDYLSENAQHDIKTPAEVFFLDNMFQALNSIEVVTPDWFKKKIAQVKEMTNIEYGIQFQTPELVKLAAGILMDDVRRLMQKVKTEEKQTPKLRMYSAHENNVAGLMAAARVFWPHQPPYCTSFILEVRKMKDGTYVVAASYSPDAGKNYKMLPIDGCGGKLLCDLDTFISLTAQHSWTKNEYDKWCPKMK